jgi:hypothetical protein
MSDSQFTVRKTYIDCVANDGRAIIGYVAELTWLGVAIPYTSLLYLDAPGNITNKARFFSPVQPVIQPDVFRWNDPKLGVSGVWQSTSSPIEETLFDSSEGALRWNCRIPRSTALVRLDGEPDMKGLGYIEDLTLTVFPWKLPVETLFWGRYISEKHYLVWIEFRGQTTKSWISLDHTPLKNVVIGEHEVDLQKGLVLRFTNTKVLEQGGKIYEVVEGLSKHVPGFKQILPHSFLHAQEWKWRSEGILNDGEKIVDRGWAIHEKVIFR